MDYCTVGFTGARMSVLSLGCMLLGPDKPAPPNARRYISNKEEGIACVRYAIDHGVNHFDSADGYGGGLSEVWLGEAIKPYPRESLLISTKLGACGKVDSSAPHVYSRPNILAACDQALQRMGTDYLDFFIFHHPGFGEFVEEALDAMSSLQQAGKIRWYGNSIYSSVPDIVATYPRLHPGHWHMGGGPLWNAPDDAGFMEIKRRGEAAVLMAPLLSGVFSGAYGLAELPEVQARFAGHWWFEKHDMAATLAAMDRVKARCGDLVAALYRYCLQLPGVASVLPGFRTLDQVKSSIAAVERAPLTPDEMQFIYETMREETTRTGN